MPARRFLRPPFAILALILSLLFWTGVSAFATPTNLGTANPYNVFVFGNDTQSYSDTQGRIAAGGNATFNGFDVAGSIGSGTTLVVGGTLTTTYGQVHGSLIANGAVLLHGPTVSGNVFGNSSVNFDQYGTVSGSVKYGTTYNKSTTTVNGSATQGTTALPFSFSAAQTELQGISSYCQSLAANGTTTISYGGITLTGTKSDLNVFSVSGTSLASATSLTINAPGGSTVLVNVSGSSGQMQNFGISINGTNRQYVLFCFAQATSLTFNSISVEGSVLAPQAAVNFAGGNLNGTLVAASLSGPGQSNHYPFLGNLTPSTPNPPVTPVLSSLTLSPTTVTGGTSSTGTVTLTAVAPSGGASVALSSNSTSATVPTSVTVAAGATTATFTVTTTTVSSATTATITASYGGVTKTATLAITVPAPVLTNLSLSPTGVTGGSSSTGTVTISSAAPAGGLAIALSSDKTASGVTVPANVTVAAGATTGTFSVTTTSVTSTVTATISATLGSVTKTATLVVSPPAITLTNLTVNPTTVIGGHPSTGTVTISSAAPAGGLAIALSSDKTGSGVTVPSSVTVASGATTATFSVSTTLVLSDITATITGVYGATKTASLLVKADVPPTVTLTSPSTGQVFASPGTIALAATATDSDGTITKVEFYRGSTLIATSTSSPYTYSWTGVAAGTYVLTAKAYDNDGLTSTSSSVTIKVNAPPTVAITSPAEGASTVAPGTFKIVASASDSDGTIAKVDFYQGSTLIGTSTSSPYTVNWTSIPSGSYTLTAIATDNDGSTATSAPVHVTVVANTPPTVTLTSPANGSTYLAPATISLAATAADSDGTITKVEFYQGTTLIGTSTTAPYTYSWTSVPAGTYVLTAKAYDNGGLTATSSSVTVTVNTLSILSVSVTPSTVPGGTSSQGTVTLSAVAPANTIVTLASNQTSASVPGSVTVPAGQSSATFSIATSAVGVNTTATITGTYNGSATAQLTITAPTISALTLDPASVLGGLPSTGTVTISSPAPTGGMNVTLSSDRVGAGVTVPTTVSIPVGQTSVQFTVSTTLVSTTVQATVSAAILGTPATTALLTVRPYAITALSLQPTSVVAMNSLMATVTISDPAPTGGLVITLASNNAAASVPVTVTVPAGQTTTSFIINTTSVDLTTVAAITASIPGSSQTADLTILQSVCVPSALTSFQITPNTVVSGSAASATVTLSSGAIGGGQVIRVSSSNADIVESFTVVIPEGQSHLSFSIPTLPTGLTTTLTVTAANHGVTQTSILNVQPATVESVSGSGTGGVTGPNGDMPPAELHLTDAAIQKGFRLTTFVYNLPHLGTEGPLSCAVTSDGGILVTQELPGAIYKFANTDNQDAAQQLSRVDYGNVHPVGLIAHGGTVFGTFHNPAGSSKPGLIAELNGDGSLKSLLSDLLVDGIDISCKDDKLLVAQDSVYQIDPDTHEQKKLFPIDALYPDGLTVTPDGGTVYIASNGRNAILGYDVETGTLVYQAFVNGPDGMGIGTGPYKDYLFVNCNDGNVWQINRHNPSDRTLIATDGTRGDLIGYSSAGELFLSQTDRVMRLIPPAHTEFIQHTHEILTRDDLPLVHGRQLTHVYSDFTTGTNGDANSLEPGRFDLLGMTGSVLAGQIQRSGRIMRHATGEYDVQWGVRSVETPLLSSFGTVFSDSASLSNPNFYSPASTPAASWNLPSSFLADVQTGMDQIYPLQWTDRISGTCEVATQTDTPQQQWPLGKNILTMLVGPYTGNAQIEQGRALDITLPGDEAPLNGAWDIVVNNVIIAASGHPNGWDVEADHTLYGGVTISVPYSLGAGDCYQVRVAGSSPRSGYFDILPARSRGSAALLLPMTLTPSALLGGVSVIGTVTLDAAAPLGGATVTLVSSDPTRASVPPSVTIPSGQTSATFPLTTFAVPSASVVTIAGEYNGYREASLTLLSADGSDPTGLDPGPGSGPGGTTLLGGQSGPGDGKTPGTVGLGGRIITIVNTLPAPTHLVAIGGEDMVTLAWDADPTHRAKRYNVGRSQTKGGPYQLLFRGLTQPGYIDTSVINGVTYYYVVNAADINGESPLSNEAAATPIAGTVPTPVISPPSGVYWEPISVTITEANRNISIRYTLDGTIPTTSSALYTSPFTLSQNATVTARAFYPGKIPSAVVSASYIVIEPTASVTITSPSYGATLQTGATVSVSATANAIDPDVLIDHLDFYANGEFIGQVNGGSGTVKWTPTTEGDYDLTAAASDVFGVVAASDPVTVTVTGTPTPPVLGCGQTLSGTLAITDAISVALGAQHYADRYTFHAAAGETVILTLSSGSFDAYLTLYDVNGTQVASNDDSLNQTTNAQIIYTIPTTGVYTVEATSYPPSQTGPYTLQLLCSPSGAAGQLSVSVDGTTVANNGLLDFGSTPQGVPLSKTLTLTNTGNADLAITGITGSGDWNIGTLGQNVISPGQSASLTARFNATNLGGASGTLVLNNTTVVNPYTIHLTGTVTTGPTVSVMALTLNPTIITGGTNSTATITLSGAAPQGGQLIGLSSDTPSVISMPTSVIVPTGQSTYSLTIRTRAVLTSTPVTITALIGLASAPFSSAQATLTLNSPGDPPTITLDAPTNNSTYSSGTIAFSATPTAHTAGATIAKVEFFNGNTKIGEDTSAPYTFNWTNVGAGDYTLHAIATDSNGLTGRSADVLIHGIDLPPLATPTITPNGGTFTGFVSVTIADTDPGVTLFYTLDGTDPDTTSPRYTGAFVLPASATPIAVTARAFKPGYSRSDPATATFTINPVSGLTRPTVAITSPGDGSEITGVPASSAVGKTSIIGSVTSTALAYWTLEYQSVGDSNWVPFAQSTNPVNNATIGYLDTTLMLDGQYDIRLTAIDQAGQSADPAIITIVIKGHQKVGYFTVSFTDMTIPIAGIPISITRTYDSRDKSNGDFGIGWTLSTTNAKVQKRQVSGYNWNQVRQGGGFSQSYVLKPVRPHLITITLPGDTVYSFQETVSPAGQAFYPLDGTTVIYQQVSGPKATLNPVGVDPNVFVQPASFDEDPNINGTNPIELYDGSNPDQVYNPTEFVLTMHNGTKFDVSQSNGLQTITDRNGNVVTFSYNGNGGCTSIDSQDGRSIVINRAGVNGTISSIKDLNNNSVRYSTDGLGNLVSYTDRVANTVTFDYDYQHSLTGIHDPQGNVPVRNYYKSDGRLDYCLDAHDNRISYDYPANLGDGGTQPANTVRTVDRLGHPTDTTYDSNGNTTNLTRYLVNLDSSTTPIITQYQFADTNNPEQPTEVIDSQGHKTNFVYDANGNLLVVTKYHTDVNNVQQQIRIVTTYNSNDRPLTIKDANGITVTTHTYDSKGNLIDSLDAMGNHTRLEYNLDGTLHRATDPEGHQITYIYSNTGPAHIPVEVIDALGHTTQFTYDNNGNRISTTTTRTNDLGQTEIITTQYVYDQNDRLAQTIYPDAHDGSGHRSTSNVYNSIGKLDHTVDIDGRATSYQYDALGQLVKTVSPDGTTSSTQYNADGSNNITIDASGRGNQYIYDSLGRVMATVPLNSSGNRYPNGEAGFIQKSTTYDKVGQILTEADENGNVTYYGYDDLGRNISTRDALGNSTYSEYDNDGRQTSSTDALGNITGFEYDDNSHLIFTDYPDGTHTQITYDNLGHRIAVTDQANHTTTYSYDEIGRLIIVTDPMSHVTRYGYDELGNKISQTDANGHTTRFAYDNMGRLISHTLPGARSNGTALTEYRSYDLSGHLSSQTDFNGVITKFVYDPQSGRLTSKQDIGNHLLISYAYNADGTRQSATRYLPTGNVTTSYTYDARGFVHSITNPIGNIIYGYDNAGNKVSTQTTSGITRYSYDVDNRLSAVTHKDGTVTGYLYDKNGNRQRLIRGNGVITTYSYDQLNRLTDIVNGFGSSYHYILNSDGKRLSVTDNSGTTHYTYNDAGWLTQESGAYGTIQYDYDNVGNRKSKIVNGTQITNYSYDVNDRLVQDGNNPISYDDDGNQTTINNQAASYDFEHHLISVGLTGYIYDADGDRLSTITSGQTTSYLVDTQLSYPSVVRELDANGNVTSYDYGDDLIRMERSSGVYYYIYDGLGSTRTLSNTGDNYYYDAFGNLLSTSSNSSGNSFLFNGQQFDQARNTYYLRARYYNQANGRFVSQDPYAGDNNEPLSLHRYLYSGNDPINHTDPSGKNWNLVGINAALGVIGTFAATHVDAVTNAGFFVYGLFDPDGAIGIEHTLPIPSSGAEQGSLVRSAISRAVTSNTGRAIRGYLGFISDWRNSPGVVQGEGAIINTAEEWLRGSNGSFGKIPKRIADNLKGKKYENFDAFRSAFWKEVAKDEELREAFVVNGRTHNITLMQDGKCPYAVDELHAGSYGIYNLHHLQPIWDGGLVYDVDNLLIVSPVYHGSMTQSERFPGGLLDPDYHYRRNEYNP